MADNITYRFIQNVGDYFPSGYFTDDFINKVQSCAGYSADDMKALCSPYVQIRGEYEEYKNFIINANAQSVISLNACVCFSCDFAVKYFIGFDSV